MKKCTRTKCNDLCSYHLQSFLVPICFKFYFTVVYCVFEINIFVVVNSDTHRKYSYSNNGRVYLICLEIQT